MITTKQHAATITELKQIPVIRPQYMTDRWQGVQHGELVETIHSELDRRGIQVLREGWYTSGTDLGRLNGRMSLSIPGMNAVEGTGFELGVQHSNLGDHALKFAIGAHIFICENGMVVGDYAVKRKHTIGLDLQPAISIGVDTYLQRINEIPQTIQTLKGLGLGEEDVDHVLMQAGRENIMAWSRIGQVDAEYRKPRFAAHNEKTGWGLYNAFTFVLQKMPPQYHLHSMNRFREIVLNVNATPVNN